MGTGSYSRRRVRVRKRDATFVAVAMTLVCAAAFTPQAPAHAQGVGSFPYSYSGRITEPSGATRNDSVEMVATFWTSDIGGNQLAQTFNFPSVILSQGVFTLSFPFTAQQVEDIFGDGRDPTFIEISTGGRTYPRQKFSFVPLAMRVPVDNQTLAFDTTSGQLAIKGTKSATTGSVLVNDGIGGVKWDSLSSTNLTAKTQAGGSPVADQVLTYKSGKWVAASLPASAPSGNYLTGLVGDVTATGPGSGSATLLSVALPGTATKVTYDAKGRVINGATLTAADLPPLSATNLSTGTLAVANGGTGVTTFTNNGVVIGSSAALSSTAAGAQYNVLTVNASSQPTFGAVNLSSANAIDGTLGLSNGGTGSTTKTAAFDALSPMNTLGDVIYGGASGSGARLAGNTTSTKQFLTSSGTGTVANAPSWSALTANDVPAHSASLITSGVLGAANGGTGAATTSPGYVLAGPAGSSGEPSFRALVAGDYPTMIGATGASAGAAGAVPGPLANDDTKFLRGDGNWATPAALAGGANGQIQFNSGGILTGDNGLIYSGGNLGIATTKPQANLDIAGILAADTLVETRGYTDLAPLAVATVTGGTMSYGGPGLRGNDSIWSVTSAGQAITFDLGFTRDHLLGVTFGTFFRADTGNIPASYAIDYSTDNSSWTNLATVTDNTSLAVRHFKRFTGRYIRITVNAFQPGKTSAYLSGVRILDDGGTALGGSYGWALNGRSVVSAVPGNIGIGTTAPLGRLHVIESSQWSAHNYSANILVGGSRNNSIGILDSINSNPWAITNTGGTLRFSQMPALGDTSTNPIGRVHFASSGEVGIGSASPAYPLDVNGTIRSTAGFMFPDGSVMTSALPTPSSGYNSRTDLNLAADSGANGTGVVAISTKGVERLRVTNSGNVAIGRSTASASLDVQGSATKNGSNQFVIQASDSSPLAANVGGGIGFGGVYTSGGAFAEWAGIKGIKDNATSGDYAGSLVLSTRASGSLTSERVRITSDGNVGIGTSQPGSKLHVSGDGIVTGNLGIGTSVPSQALEVAGVIKSNTGGFMFPDGTVMTTAATGSITAATSATDLNLASDSTSQGTGDIMLSTRGNERLRVTNAGKVGIGTTAPVDLLSVWSPKVSTVTAEYPGLAVGDSSLANTGVGGGISFWGNHTSTTPIAGAAIHAMKNNSTAGDTGFNLAFNTRANGGSLTERMRISSTGNVGIGSIAPSSKLAVNGTGYFAGNVGIGTTAPVAPLHIASSGTATMAERGIANFYFPGNNNLGGGFSAYKARGNSASPIAVADGDFLGGLVLGGHDGSGYLNTAAVLSRVSGTVATGSIPTDIVFTAGSTTNNWSERMRITSSGNVGIGTTMPASKLEVAGQIKSTSGGIMFPDGSVMTSAVAPSVGSSSITDLNLGADIGAAGSGVISLSTAGAERVRVSNSGKVGIGLVAPVNTLDVAGGVAIGSSYAGGTIAPTDGLVVQGNVGIGTNLTESKLSVAGDASFLSGDWTTGNVLTLKNSITSGLGSIKWSPPGVYGTGRFLLFSNETTVNEGTGFDGGIIFRTNSKTVRDPNPNMIISQYGNVGIGTTTPQRALDVKSGTSGNITEQLVLRNGSATTASGTGSGLYFALTSAASARHAAIDAVVGNAATGATDLTLSTSNGTSVTEKMRIQAGGSVGIGTTAPFNMLSVAGGADFTGNVGIGSAVPTQALDVAGVIRSSSGGIMFPDGSIMTSAATPGTGTSSASDLTFAADSGNTGTGVVSFATRGSERMRVSNTGNIGFGTSTPLSKVDVNGGMAIGTYAGTAAAATGNLIVSGNVGVGTSTVTGAKLSVMGGNVGIGTAAPDQTLHVSSLNSELKYGDEAGASVLRLISNNGSGTSSVNLGNANRNWQLRVEGGDANKLKIFDATTVATRMTFDSSGNVGIGSTTPNQKLEVAGVIKSTSGGFMFPDGTVMTSAAGGTSTGSASAGDLTLAAGTSAGGALLLSTQNTERMRIEYGGNVGIGTTAPQNKLDVAGSVAIGSGYAGGTTGPSNGLIVQGNVGVGTTIPSSVLDVASTSNGVLGPTLSITNLGAGAGSGGSLDFRVGPANQTQPIEARIQSIDDSGYSAHLTFLTKAQSSGGALSEKMRISSTGNVGIGTTAPTANLSVVGSNSATLHLQAATHVVSGDNSTLILNAGGASWGSTPTIKLTGQDDGASGGIFNIYTNNTKRLSILHNGNVGIGTTAPTQKLDVAGAIRSTSGGFIFPDGTSMTTAITATTAGSSSTEDLNFAADSDASGAGALVVSTGGVERMRVLNGGNIGIGTSVPKSALDIAGSASIGSYAGNVTAPANGLIVSGKVGIGTISPAAQLEVVGTAGARIVDSSNANTYAGSLIFGNLADAKLLYAPNDGTLQWRTHNHATGHAFEVYDKFSSTTKVHLDSGGATYFNGGNVGIGTTNPTNILQVGNAGRLRVSNGITDYSLFGTLDDDGPTNTRIVISGNTRPTYAGNIEYLATSTGNHIFYTTNSRSEQMRITSAGNVGIGTTTTSYTLHVNGSVAGVGSYNALYDIRYKKDIHDLAGSLAKVLAIRGVSYKWKDEDKYGRGSQLGVIAQEIERVVPEVVTTDADGVKRVKYDDLIPLIIEAMKAAQANKDAEILALKADAAQLRAEKDAEIALLKAALCSKFSDLAICSH